jgi:hypothetical protein
MSIVNIVGGTVLLAFGRKVFWLFVAAIGFFAGLELANRFLQVKPAWVAFVIALAVGLVGALLAYFFQKLAISVAGFLAGAYIAARLASQLAVLMKIPGWLILLIGGIIGIILMSIIFEWALTVLSSLAGAILVVDGFKLAGLIAVIVGVLLFVVGLVFQTSINRRNRSRKKVAI